MDDTDELIRSQVVEALSRDSRFSHARLTVRVENAQVLLFGDTPTLYLMQLVIDLAGCMPGVRGVQSALRVWDLSHDDDQRLQVRVEQVLKWSASLGASNLGISVERGVLTLDGKVDAYWKRQRAEALVMDIQGVLAVINQLQVVPELTPQDQVIADDVKSAIARCGCSSRDHIHIEVESGMVTLSGQVPSLWSKRYAPSLVEAVLGVTGVVDKLVVTQSVAS